MPELGPTVNTNGTKKQGRGQLIYLSTLSKVWNRSRRPSTGYGYDPGVEQARTGNRTARRKPYSRFSSNKSFNYLSRTPRTMNTGIHAILVKAASTKEATYSPRQYATTSYVLAGLEAKELARATSPTSIVATLSNWMERKQRMCYLLCFLLQVIEAFSMVLSTRVV